MNNPRKLKVLVLEGTPYNRGLIHGKTLKADIQELVKLWKTDLKEKHRIDCDLFIKKFMQKTDYVSSIKKWTPDLIDEIKGLSDGSGIDYDTMFVFQCTDEFMASVENITSDKCSCLGFSRSGNQSAYVAQTMDVETFRDGFQTILHVKHADSNHEELVLAWAGFIGLNGINNRGIGICCNAVYQLNSALTGLPVSCIVRGVLSQKTEKDAVAFVNNIKHASGQNYVMGGPDKTYSFECSASKVVRYIPEGEEIVVWHTNHPIVNMDLGVRYKATLGDRKIEDISENSVMRLQNLKKRLGNNPSEPRLDLIKATLTSKDDSHHPICTSKGRDEWATQMGFFTFSADIMELSDKPVFYATAGPGNLAPFEKLTFSKYPGESAAG